MSFHSGSEPARVRRTLERPLGSVRCTEEAPANEVPGDLVIGLGSIR
jgi:hypothetical protein